MRRFLLPVLVLLAGTATAQTSRQVRPLTLAPQLQGEAALTNGDYALLTVFGARATGTDAAARSLGLDTRGILAGYEHFWNAQWSIGVQALLLYGGTDQRLFIPQVLVRHRSPVFGGITFGQRLDVERSFPHNFNYTPASAGQGQTWARLRVDLEKLLPIGASGVALRPRLSYEAATHLRLQKDVNDGEERTIQETNFRVEVGVRLSPTIDFTPWFAYGTSYLVTLPQYDKNGLQVSGGNLNNVYPVLGLDVRFTLLQTGGKADRQQLPTQH
jgi:hypothetical protein